MDDIKRKIADAHDHALVVKTGVDHVAAALKVANKTAAKLNRDSVPELTDRLRLLARLCIDCRAHLDRSADLIAHAEKGLHPLALLWPPPIKPGGKSKA